MTGYPSPTCLYPIPLLHSYDISRMEIVCTQREDHLELAIEGRLDGYWAQHLSTSVGDVMREGAHSVRLNLARINYISSAGIGVLVDLHKQFAAVGGVFAVISPSRAVWRILEMVGLATLLTDVTSQTSPAAATRETLRREIGGATFEIHDLLPAARLTCRLSGNPGLLAAAGYTATDCTELTVRENALSLGLGAFGDNFEAARDRFGEFLAVAGAAAAQPTDGTNFPDYMLSSGEFVPRLATLYHLACEGGFGKLVRFEGSEPIALSTILGVCHEAAGARTAGVVMLAESAGLMGALLKCPPVSGDRIFAFPAIREWLSFSAERCFARSLALAGGVVTAAPDPVLAPFVRPLSKGSALAGHIHAAAFSYRPLPKGATQIKEAVRELFAGGGLQGVLHLLADDRDIPGAGESELLRGACWISPVTEVAASEAIA
jgi:anti-anti-sigma factor